MTELEPKSSDLLDYERMKASAGFVLRSVRRHKLLAIALFAFVVAGAGAGLAVMPRSYHVETRLLVRLDPLLPSLAEPGRALSDADATPLRAAVDMITARSNLMALAQRADVLNAWSRNRAPILRLKDVVLASVAGEPPEKERLERLVDLLRAKLVVWYEAAGQPNQGTVTISINWPDGDTAFRLVQAAQEHYIEARHLADVSAVAEVKSILEAHASVWRAEAREVAGELRKTQTAKHAVMALPQPTPPAPIQKVVDPPDPELERLASLLATKRRTLNEMEEARVRNLTDLQKRLAELKAVYTDQHPAVIRAQERLDAESREPAQLAAIRAEIDGLEAGVLARRRPPLDNHVEPVAPAAVARIELPPANELEDPAVDAARARLRFALDKVQNLRARADSAALELEARRAAFKYRYSVVVPAEPPRGPTKPNAAAVGAAGIIAGVLLAAFGAVVADLRGGRLVESWQVERALQLPVLAELTRP